MGLLDSIRSVLGLRRKPRYTEELEIEMDDVEVLDDDDLELDSERPAFDSGTFDFDRDIGRYFTAEFRIETATHDPVRREQLFAEYNLEGLEHWHRIQAAFEQWRLTPAGQAKYRTTHDLMQARMSTTQTMTLADLGISVVSLQPILGVTIEQWAKVEAAVEAGEPLRPLVADLRIDPETWARIAAAWHQRMIDDPSGRIATEYMLHFGVRTP